MDKLKDKAGKDMKKKIVLILVCFGILLGIFVRSIVLKVNSVDTAGDAVATKKDEPLIEETMTEEGGILRAEAFRLISYLYYEDSMIGTIKNQITFDDCTEGAWYTPYVNAIYAAGFTNQAEEADDQYKIRPTDVLTVSECILLMEQLAQTKGIDPAMAYTSSGIELEEEEPADYMKVEDFLRLYEAVVEQIDAGENSLGSSEDSSVSEDSSSLVKIEKLYLLSEEDDNNLYTHEGIYNDSDIQYYDQLSEEAAVSTTSSKNVEDYLNQLVEVVVSGDKILYLKAVLDEPVTLENVYIIHGEKQTLEVFCQNVTMTLQTSASLSTEIDETVGNITLDNDQVTEISVKPDKVTGKVLLASEDYIELEGYGKVELDPEFKIYKLYGDLSMEDVNAILVGYSNTEFVLTDNKISAALITEPITAADIRVAIKTNGYKGYYHEEVTLTSNKAFTIYYGDKTKKIKANKSVKISKDSKYLTEGRLRVESNSEDGTITISSIERSQGNPSYRGTIEISSESEGLLIVNELSIEEYLYAVVPSEMPTSYGLEALKVQAVCARSYAYTQLMANSCSAYGAHVDDSSSYQVYNNLAEDSDSIKAVKETYGQVIESNDEIITAYYFSTSCGYTSSMQDVWSNGKATDYLVGSLQVMPSLEDSKDAETVQAIAEEVAKLDLSDEDAFRDFLTNNSYDTLDSEFPWYRWKVVLSYEQLTKSVNENLATRYAANPELILTQKTENGQTTYVSNAISEIGDVTGLEVMERKSSGIVTSLLIQGTKASIVVKTEYNIRALLAPTEAEVVRQDDSTIENLTLLPSAFIIIDETTDEDGNAAVQITGGGYGHGVGMSQNGVKAMVELGYDYEAILKHYYTGTTLDTIYEAE